MTGEFTLTLKDANSSSVIKTVTIPAIITDFYKYESTFGFPFMTRDYKPGGAVDSFPLQSMTSFINSSGIRLFENELDEDNHKMQVGLSDTYCGYASRYNSSSGVASYSDKCGYMTGFSRGTAMTNADGRRRVQTISWHWDADKGNGTIKSIGTGHAAGVHAIDTTQIASLDTDVTLAGGIDFNTFYTCVNSRIGPQSVNVSDVSGINSLAYMDTGISYSYMLPARVDAAAMPREFYYQTDKNIIQLWFNTKNVLNENGEYVSKIRYRIINKKWFYKYCVGIAQHVHPLSIPDVDSPNCKYDGEITLNSGVYPLISDNYNVTDITSGHPHAIVEDAAYAVFIAQAGEAAQNPNPDAQVISDKPLHPIKTFIIRGDSPTVYQFNSNYDSPLTNLFEQIHYSGAVDPGASPSNFLFFKDYSYMYIEQPTVSSDRYFVKRYLANDVLAYKKLFWRAPTSSSYSLMIVLDFIDTIPNAFKIGLRSADLGEVLESKILSSADGETILGYCSEAIYQRTNSSTETRRLANRTILRPDNDSPFRLVITGEDNKYRMLLNTNFLFAKANLTEAITKTSAHTLDITLKLYEF